tara:strand:- start:2 stop:691 length:690 start_codon:yes stop_codon:yes gene_type:complete
MNEKDRIVEVYDRYINDSLLYNRWSEENLGNKIIYDERYEHIVKLLNDFKINLKNKRILDIGCAGGNIFPLLIDLGIDEKNINGIDIRSNRIKDAKKLFPKSKLNIMDARKLDFNSNSFDIIITFTLFSSILDEDFRIKIANEILRVLKSGGVIIYYDLRYNNPFNRNVIKMSYDEINDLFPKMGKKLDLVTVAPPLIRRIGCIAEKIYPILSKLNFLNTHYLGLLIKE